MCVLVVFFVVIMFLVSWVVFSEFISCKFYLKTCVVRMYVNENVFENLMHDQFVDFI